MSPSRWRLSALVASAAILLAVSQPASVAWAQLAQPVRCSAFLHNHDGSWSSFVDATFLAMRGPVHVHPGERLTGRGSPAQVDLTQLLNHLCQAE